MASKVLLLIKIIQYDQKVLKSHERDLCCETVSSHTYCLMYLSPYGLLHPMVS